MDLYAKAREITDELIEFRNEENLNWNEVYTRVLDSVGGLTPRNRDVLLIRIVDEISRRGYLIEDFPFRITR